MLSLSLAVVLVLAWGVATQSTPSVAEISVDLVTPTGTLHGTELIPQAPGPEPVVLIIAGSGPTDRNGNSALITGENNSLKLLAEGLATQGIASVRYDKRGVGESLVAGQKEEELRFENYVEDAALWVKQLQAEPRFSKVTIIGHSEGSLIGMLAAQQTGADAFISIAGPARKVSEVLRDQLRSRLSEQLQQDNDRILGALERGETVTALPPEFNLFYRSTVQPYLISWFRYTPAEEIKRLGMPVLIVQGTTDIQVAVDEAQVLKTSKPEARLVLIEGMNHVLKSVPSNPIQQALSYGDPTLPVVPELIEAISQFMGTFHR